MIDGIPDLVVVAVGVLFSGTVVVVFVRVSMSLQLRFRSDQTLASVLDRVSYRRMLQNQMSTVLLRSTVSCPRCATSFLAGKRLTAFNTGSGGVELRGICPNCSRPVREARSHDYIRRHLDLFPAYTVHDFNSRAASLDLKVEFNLHAERLSARMPPEFAPMRDEIADAMRDGFGDPDRDESKWTATQERELRRMWFKSLRQRMLSFLPGRRRA